MSGENATADELYRLLLDVQGRLTVLMAYRLTLERNAERAYGTAQRAVKEAVEDLDAARQIFSALETGN